MHEARHRPDGSGFILCSCYGDNLKRANDSDHAAAPPRQSRKANVRAYAIEVSRDWGGNSATCSARRGGKAVYFSQDGARGCGFLEHDEKHRIGEDGGEVSDCETDPETRVEGVRGEEGEVGNDQVSDGGEDGNGDEGGENAQPGGEEGEDYSLNEEGDETVNGHNEADCLEGEAKTAGDVEGGTWVVRGGWSFILEEDGEEVVVGHAVVGVDAEGNHNHDDFAGKDFGFRGVAGVDGGRAGSAVGVEVPFFVFVDVNGVEGAVGVSAKVDASVCCRSGSGHEGRLSGGIV